MAWRNCLRNGLMLRGHNTNNNAEAQCLVIEDKVLQRVKEYNVVSLMETLIIEFKNHYKDKLLNVASGSYDSYTACRFDGKSKKKGKLGYKVSFESLMIIFIFLKLFHCFFLVTSKNQLDKISKLATKIGLQN